MKCDLKFYVVPDGASLSLIEHLGISCIEDSSHLGLCSPWQAPVSSSQPYQWVWHSLSSALFSYTPHQPEKEEFWLRVLLSSLATPFLESALNLTFLIWRECSYLDHSCFLKVMVLGLGLILFNPTVAWNTISLGWTSQWGSELGHGHSVLDKLGNWRCFAKFWILLWRWSFPCWCY